MKQFLCRLTKYYQYANLSFASFAFPVVGNNVGGRKVVVALFKGSAVDIIGLIDGGGEDGIADGCTVGGTVDGPLDRTLLGAIVGATVEESVVGIVAGPLDGTPIGAIVGAAVGGPSGSAVGPLDGTLLGATVDGDNVRACEGPYEGPVGEAEGVYVGGLVRRIKIVKDGNAVGST